MFVFDQRPPQDDANKSFPISWVNIGWVQLGTEWTNGESEKIGGEPQNNFCCNKTQREPFVSIYPLPISHHYFGRDLSGFIMESLGNWTKSNPKLITFSFWPHFKFFFPAKGTRVSEEGSIFFGSPIQKFRQEMCVPHAKLKISRNVGWHYLYLCAYFRNKSGLIWMTNAHILPWRLWFHWLVW